MTATSAPSTGQAQAHAAQALTWLFVTGDRPDRFAKAADSGADAIIIDWEDGVAPEARDDARTGTRKYIDNGRPAYVRVNGSTTRDHAKDVAALEGLGPGLRGVVVPKSESPEVFTELDATLAPGVVCVALVETAAGILAAPQIARAPRVTRLTFGSADFALQTGVEDAAHGLLQARSTLVLASAAAGLAEPIAGITTALDDVEQACADAAAARRLGFGAKLCLHPKQIAPTLRGLAPTDEQARWAKRVINAAQSSRGKAVRVDGQMVDAPVLHRAERIWQRHEQMQKTLQQIEGSQS